MLSVRCPQCGKPAPVDLSAPDALRCDACHFVGAPDAEAAARIGAARELLLSMGANRRQLGTLAGRALGSATIQMLIYAVVALGLLLPPLVFAVFLSFAGTWMVALLGFIPLLFLLVVAALGIVALRRSFAGLAAACAARPPRAPGEPARCHVCGGPLSADQGVVRCGFCGSDNLVGQGVRDRAHAFDEAATADLSQTVQAHADAVANTWRRLLLSLVAGLFAGPMLMFVLCGCSVYATSLVEFEAGESRPTTLVERDGVRCFGQLLEDGRLWFGGRPEYGYWAWEQDADRAAYEWVEPTSYIGRRVRAQGSVDDSDPVEGRFDRIVGTIDGGNEAVVVTDAGEERRHAIGGLCLTD